MNLPPSAFPLFLLCISATLFVCPTTAAAANPSPLPAPFRRGFVPAAPFPFPFPFPTTLLSAYPLPSLNVYDFGAKGDEVSDDTAAFQAALDAAGNQGGGTVVVPPGKFLFKGTLVMPNRCSPHTSTAP